MHKPVVPPFLKPGDTIGLIAPSRWVDEELLTRAETIIRTHGFTPLRGKNTDKRKFQFGGNDSERAADFRMMLDHPEVKAIMALRGGYGLIRIIDRLDFSVLARNPKWICGFSDFTIAHARANIGHDIVSLHCSMPVSFETNTPEAVGEIFSALRGEWNHRVYTVNTLREGRSEGKLLGGNLSILQSLLGSPDQLPDGPYILFIEDIGEYLYHIERLLISLKRAGKLERVQAVIAGGFSDMRDHTPEFGHTPANPFGKTCGEILAEVLSEFEIPVCMDFPAGHISDNRPLFLGRNVRTLFEPGRLRMEYL